MIHEDVSIETVFYDPPHEAVAFDSLEGAVKITVGDTVLTAYSDEFWQDYPEDPEETREYYDATGQKITDTARGYRRDYLFRFFPPALTTMIDIHKSSSRFDEQIIGLSKGTTLVVSYLNGDAIRVAFQGKTPEESDGATTEAALGFAVDADAFSAALADATEEYLEYTDRGVGQPGELGGPSISGYTRTLRSHIED